MSIYKRHFYMFDFRQGVTYANDFNKQTDTQTKTETDMSLAISESCRFAE